MKKKTIFVDRANIIEFRRATPTPMIDHIPAAVYEPFVDHEAGIQGLERVFDKFEQSSPVRYGEFNKYKQQIFDTLLKRRDTSTGAVILGDPGTGKTLMAEDIANQLISRDYPVLYIKRKWPVSFIHDLVSRMGPCMVFFDEFGKNYEGVAHTGMSLHRGTRPEHIDQGEQAELLLLFSDSSLKGVFFYISSNGDDAVGTKGVMNRPSRFLFRIDSNQMELSSYHEMISQHPMTKEMRAFLYNNVFSNGFLYKNPQYSSDSLRFVLGLVNEDTTPSQLLSDIKIFNLPYHRYWRYHLVILCNNSKSSEYEFKIVSVEDDIIHVLCKHKEGKYPEQVVEINFDLNEIVKNRIDSRQLLISAELRIATNVVDMTMNLFDNNIQFCLQATPSMVELPLSNVGLIVRDEPLVENSLDTPPVPAPEASPGWPKVQNNSLFGTPVLINPQNY